MQLASVCQTGIADNTCPAGSAHDALQRFIVRLLSYQPLAHAQRHISEALSTVPDWQLAYRSRQTYTFDTDFVVLEAPPHSEAALRAALVKERRVRDIHEDKVVRRPLVHRSGSDYDDGSGSSGTFDADDDGTVRKRSGRLSTAWSWDSASEHQHPAPQLRQSEVLRQRFEAHQQHMMHSAQRTQSCNASSAQDRVQQHCSQGSRDQAPFPAEHHKLWGNMLHADDNEDAGEQLAHQRRLLMGNQVSTALNAAALWDQGFKGQGIRVGAHQRCCRGQYTHQHLRLRLSVVLAATCP